MYINDSERMGRDHNEKNCVVPVHCPTQEKCVHLVIKVNEFRAVNNLQSFVRVSEGYFIDQGW